MNDKFVYNQMDKTNQPPFHSEEEAFERRMAMTYTERYYMFIKLYRIGQMLKNAKIIEAEAK